LQDDWKVGEETLQVDWKVSGNDWKIGVSLSKLTSKTYYLGFNIIMPVYFLFSKFSQNGEGKNII
jgi:hypothetical protein